MKLITNPDYRANPMGRKNKTNLLAALLCVTLAACSSSDDSDGAGIGIDDNVIPAETTAFNFATAEPADYTRVDRAGMPAIATALIASDDSYNAADPVDDIASAFVPEILNSLTFLHGALDTQLQGLGLTPCTVVGDGTGTCAQFAVPLIIPDTVKIDTSAAAGFPNGRLLTDPVIGVTLAVALLELTGETPPHTAVDLVGVLNPAANDVPFDTSFPFLAPAN